MRPANFLDIPLLMAVYQEWPVTEDNPPVYERDVRDWVRRWKVRDDEKCEVLDGIGFILYRREGDWAWITNLGVHPDERGKGYANQMMADLKTKLVSEGVTRANFEAIPGPIADQVKRGKFRELGERQGKTGTLVVGEVTADMEI